MPPSSTTVRKMFKVSRSIILIIRMIAHIYSFVSTRRTRSDRLMESHCRLVTHPPLLSVAAVCASAMIALAVAMGVGRFAFTPLLPLMLRDGLLGPTGGEWLAASNYLG